MEIERKWMVTGWPEGLTQTSDYQMDQGYVSVRPTVRIRREALQGGRTALVLCFKGAGTLSREEIEAELSPEDFTGRAPQQVEEFLAEVIRPVLDANKEDLGQHVELNV